MISSEMGGDTCQLYHADCGLRTGAEALVSRSQHRDRPTAISKVMLACGANSVKATELLLPEPVRRKASVSAGGEHAWRQHDVEEVLHEAHAAGLACLGGQVQFQTREGIADAYWLNFDPRPRLNTKRGPTTFHDQ
jgi:hypothetical protein